MLGQAKGSGITHKSYDVTFKLSAVEIMEEMGSAALLLGSA